MILAGRRLFLYSVVAACAVGVGVSAQPSDGELQLKAAFIFRFPEFVTWPTAAVEGRTTFDLCMYSSGSMAAIVEDLVAGESIGGRPVKVIRVRTTDVPAGCQALVVAGGSDGVALLKQIAGRPILTIGDSPSFLDDGGVILLKTINQRVRFEVDLANAQRAGLQISSQLLRLALAVRGGPA